MGDSATAKKKETNFYLIWEDIDPPPGADPRSKWRRCMAGCRACGYNTVSESMICDEWPELKIEAQVLDILRFSALPIYCMDYTAFLIAYAKRGKKQKEIADRISAEMLAHMKLLDQMKKDGEDAKPRRPKKRRAKKPARGRRPAARERKEPRRTRTRRGVSNGDRGEGAGAPDADRNLERKAGVRDPLAKRPRKADADGDRAKRGDGGVSAPEAGVPRKTRRRRKRTD